LDSVNLPEFILAVVSGDSRMKKVGGHCATKEKAGGGQHKYLSCMVMFHCFED